MTKEDILKYIEEFPDGANLTFNLFEPIDEKDLCDGYPYMDKIRKFTITHGYVSDNGYLELEEI